MTTDQTSLVLGFLIVLVLFCVWVRTEMKSSAGWKRIGSGLMAGLCSLALLLAFSNSLRDYYDGMHEHELLLTLIRAYPSKRADIEAWALKYPHSAGDNSQKRRELDAILQRTP